MKVVPVEPIGVELFWNKIKPLVKKATDYSGGRHTVDTTKYLCETGMMNLWLVFKDVKNIEAIITTQKVIYPARTMMSVVLCGGKNMNKWARLAINTVNDYAKKEKCSGVEVMGRPGWRKIFKQHTKYKESYVLFEKDF